MSYTCIMYICDWCCFMYFNMSRVMNMIYIWVCPEFKFTFEYVQNLNLFAMLDLGRFNCQKCINSTNTWCMNLFLAPPAERQRSFSNADSSVVRRRPSSVVVNFSLKILISQKLPDNFFSFFVYSFLRKVPMYCINIDLIESS